MNDNKDNTKKDYKKTEKDYEISQPKWIIEGNFTDEQLKEAYRLLDSGVKIRKVALRLNIHRSKIRSKQ